MNVIAHSQGGLDSRMVASRCPALFAALVTVSTPHRGTPVSDLISQGLSNPQARAAVSPNAFDPVGHDGLVPVASAKWGTFLGCIPADHLDEIGQIGGLSPGVGNDWRHKPFYLSLVQFLRARGY